MNRADAEGRGALQYIPSNGDPFTVLLKLCGGKLKEYKNTQPLIGMPETLPETGVSSNHSSGKFERNERKKEWQNE